MSRLLVVLLIFSLLAGCTLQSVSRSDNVFQDNPYAPQSGDGSMMRGDGKVVSATVLTDGPNVTLQLAYYLPTPCYKLRVSSTGSDSQNRINLDVYGVAIKDRPCSLMALATPLQASLTLASLPTGHYAVMMNGEKIGEFDK